MQAHPSYQVLSGLLTKYPRAAGCLFQTYNDITLAQKWNDVEVLDLEPCGRGAIKGRRPDSETLSYVVPCALRESLSIEWFQSAFDGLQDPKDIHLAITSDDSSIVYYKIGPGIVKPPM